MAAGAIITEGQDEADHSQSKVTCKPKFQNRDQGGCFGWHD